MDKQQLQRRKKTTAVIAFATVAGMLGVAFAMVPLYRVICQVIGVGGTTQVSTAASKAISDVPVTVRFNTNVDPQLPWEFKPNQKSITTKFGETKTVTFHARNLSDKPITGTATFNVTPEKTGIYFQKIQCFCFDLQTLQPGEAVDMAVSFFVDPDLLTDVTTEEVRTITLSYTFFRSANEPSSAGREADVKQAARSGAETAIVPN